MEAEQEPPVLDLARVIQLVGFLCFGATLLLYQYFLEDKTGQPVEYQVLVWTLPSTIGCTVIWRLYCRSSVSPRVAGIFKKLATAGVIVLLGITLWAGFHMLLWQNCMANLSRHCLLDRTGFLLRYLNEYSSAQSRGGFFALKYQQDKQFKLEWLDHGEEIVRVTARSGDTDGVNAILNHLDTGRSMPARLAAAEEFSLQPAHVELSIALLASMGQELQSDQYASIIRHLRERRGSAALDTFLDRTPATMMRHLLACQDCQDDGRRPRVSSRRAFGFVGFGRRDCGSGFVAWSAMSPLANALIQLAQERAESGDQKGARRIVTILVDDPYLASAGLLTLAAGASSRGESGVYRANRQVLMAGFTKAAPDQRFELAAHGLPIAVSASDMLLASSMRIALHGYPASNPISADRITVLATELAKAGFFQDADKLRMTVADAKAQHTMLECFAIAAAEIGNLDEAVRRSQWLESAKRRQWATILLAAAEEVYVRGTAEGLLEYCYRATTDLSTCMALDDRLSSAVAKERKGLTRDASAELGALVNELVSVDKDLKTFSDDFCQSAGKNTDEKTRPQWSGPLEKCTSPPNTASSLDDVIRDAAEKASERCIRSDEEKASLINCSDSDLRAVWRAYVRGLYRAKAGQGICQHFADAKRLPLLLELSGNRDPSASQDLFTEGSACVETLARAGYGRWLVQSAEKLTKDERVAIYVKLASFLPP